MLDRRDQPDGKKRPATAADRAAIQSYRSGRKAPVFSTNFTDPAKLQAACNLVSDDNTWGDFQSCRRPSNVEAASVGLRLKTLIASDCHHKWSTGYINSKVTYNYGFFEATMKIADIKGMNNAFWMTTEDHPETGDHFEIDVSEVQYPNYDHIGLQQYPAKGNKNLKHTGMGWGAKFIDDLSSAFHNYGVLWTPTEMIFEIDGEPVAAVVTNNAVKGPTDVAFSSALIYAGVPDHPEGHDVVVLSNDGQSQPSRADRVRTEGKLMTMRHKIHAVLACLITAAASVSAGAQAISQLCTPKVAALQIVVSPKQRYVAGQKAEPPLTDAVNGLAWPDTPMGVIRTANGYEFFASDGGQHSRQMWQGHWVGNNKYGSVVSTRGTLDNPLGPGHPQDVSVSANPGPGVNPNYPSYGYMGGGPVYQVPAGMTGAGNLLATYHAELPNDALYAALGLAASTDSGLHWTDLGEIIRLNQAYAVGLDGFEIGDGPLVLSPDAKYFYLYFPDWIANGTLHATTTTNVSVARALASSVLEAAFGSKPPHTVAFEKFYKGSWHLQPGIGGASTDLNATSAYRGYLDIHYNGSLRRYVMIISDDTQFAYAESIDALTWTTPTLLGTFGPIAAYPTAVGFGDDPHILGKNFYVYYTHLPTDGTGWTNGELRRLTLSCP